ncbi:hypothetical protein O3M35_006875 [Rhynocoris fuscipes]|uniref:Protein kinase domain-containing protein n=1 Tax=Rhynocoris fuscipes TaxID=488301 RepID=A0AAW1DGR0_9HEMI
MPFFKTKLLFKPTAVDENYGSKNMSVIEASVNHNFLTASEEYLMKEKGYTFIRHIGEGSYAKVFLAKFVQEGKPEVQLACKIINTRMAPREFVVKFLPREIDILSKITHPYIVHVYSIYHKAFNYLIFMRYAEMGDLLDYIVAKGELPEKVGRTWFHQLASAIYYLHNLNIAHRDIKCENILITKSYNVKLADFGFARYVCDGNGRHLLSNTYCGSLAYASPEILRGRAYFPKCSDIWSLGVVLYIMLNKCMPFRDGNVKVLYKQQLAKRWTFRAKVETTISAAAVNMVKYLLEPDFRKRILIKDVMKDRWFTDEGLYLSNDCNQALDLASKYKSEMVCKKSVKGPKVWDKEEKDFTLISKERDPITSASVYFDPTLGSQSLGGGSVTSTTTDVDLDSKHSEPERQLSNIQITEQVEEKETESRTSTDNKSN